MEAEKMEGENRSFKEKILIVEKQN